MKLAITLGLALLATACTTQPNSGVMTESNKLVSYTCDRGESVEVRYLQNEDAAVLIRHGDEIRLDQQISASGFIYSNGPNTIRGKGDELRVEIGRMMPLLCKARK